MANSLQRLSGLTPLVLAAFLAGTPATRAAEQPDAKGIAFFESKIRPVLVNNCYECHSAKAAKVQGRLLLDTRDGIRKGGEKGPGVVPGKPEDSLVVTSLRHTTLKMPPKTKLPDRVVADFEQWVKMGAPDPRDAAGATAYKRLSPEEAKSFWSLKPVEKPAAPPVKDSKWARDDLDRFILAKLEAKGLKPNADADKRTLLRRVYFDLIGLPPTPEEVEAFLKDASPDAFAKVVDKLLASPHYGERWGRHWLDIARYAESNGNADNTPFPQAYKYRDYVIDAFNKDKPYNRFVQEQVCGDLLPAKDAKEKDESLTATGFLALTSKPRAQNNPDYRFDLIADQIDVTSRAFLGLSVMCARCHDHKFDLIATKEYYALAGIFDSTQMLFGGAGKGNKANGPGGLHTLSSGESAMGVKDSKVVDCQVRIRGDSDKIGESVPRGVLSVVNVNTQPKFSKAQSGRLELAGWLTTPENPLTARVAVNRIWLHLFGQGIVRSPDNFGFLGERPSHPELLDHLAVRFLENGWSTKAMIRTIVLSHTYQLGSAHNESNYKADPDNVLLWRMPQRRLEAEAIRDAVLVVSGRLDPKPPKGIATETAGNKKGKKATYDIKDTNNRSVYLGSPRGTPLPEILAVFDAANPNLSMAQREVTTVPAQALFMMNSPFIASQSKSFAQRLLEDSKLDDASRIDRAYQLALARPATDAERERVLAYLKKSTAKDQTSAWASFCQAIFASAEFRYVE